MVRKSLAGLPATIALGGTSLVTTLPAPTIAFSPMTICERMVAPEPIEAPVLTTVFSTFQSPGKRSVDEYDSMANEDVILDGHPFAHECVTGDFAVTSDDCVFLHFNECADLGGIADCTAIQIDEGSELHVLPQLDVRSDALHFVHRATASPRLWTD